MKTLRFSILVLLVLFSNLLIAQQTFVVDVSIDVEECILTNSISSNNENLYPNPTDQYINFNSKSAGTLSIIDQTGKQVLTQEISKGEEAINIQSLKAGIYLIRIRQNGDIQTIKIIVQ